MADEGNRLLDAFGSPLPADDNGDSCLPHQPPRDDQELIHEGCYVVLDQHQKEEKMALLAVCAAGCVTV